MPANKSTSLQPKHAAGPRTETGKRRARGNATKFGLYTRDVTIETAYFAESPREFHRLHQKLRAEYQPRTFSEEYIVRKYAEAIWKLERIKRIEALGTIACLQDGRHRYAGTVQRQLGDLVYHSSVTYGTSSETEGKRMRDDLYRQAEEREIEARREELARGETPEQTRVKLFNLLAFWEGAHRAEAHERRILRGLEDKISQLFLRPKRSKGVAGRDSHFPDDGRHSD